MDVIVDGYRDFPVEGNPRDVLGAVTAIAESLRRQGRALIAVKADGRSIEADSLVETFQDAPLDAVGQIEVRSEEVAKLVADCIEALQRTLPDLPTACRQLAAVFQGSSPEEGFEPFQHLAEIWGQVKAHERMAANALALPLDRLELDGTHIGALHEELTRFLGEAAAALEAGDLILLGDLLEYELAPRAETELRIVAILQEHARQQAE